MGFRDILTELSSRIDLQKLRGFPVPFPRIHTTSFQRQYDVVSMLKRRRLSTGSNLNIYSLKIHFQKK